MNQFGTENRQSHSLVERAKLLSKIIKEKPFVRVLEVHNGISGIIAETVRFNVAGVDREFDALWESSLTDSLSKGKPDRSVVDMTSRIQTIDQILDVTTKPIIVDVDNGGTTDYFRYSVRTLERLGVSAVIVEDKVGEKRNSLFGTEANQQQDSVEAFSEKIAAGVKAKRVSEFMVIARIESLILKVGIEDALKRAQAYIGAGADGIMIHSNSKTFDEIRQFAARYHEINLKKPLVVVPTTYASVAESELFEAGIQVVIYANHMLRSAIPAMQATAKSILAHQRSLETDWRCMSVSETIGFGEPKW